MPNRAIGPMPKPGTRSEKRGKPRPRQRPLRPLPAECAADDRSPIHDWVQSQLRKLGDMIHIIDHGGVLLEQDQAVLVRRALGDAYAYRSEMLGADPENDLLRRQYLALFNRISD